MSVFNSITAHAPSLSLRCFVDVRVVAVVEGFLTEIKIFNVLLVKDFFYSQKKIPVPFFLF